MSAALSRLSDRADERGWDLVIGLTELPLRDDGGRYLLVQTDPQRTTAVLSLPALGGLHMHRRSGRWRQLFGMVLANRPWLLVPGLKTALVAALTTGAIATINSTVWLLAHSLSPWRLVVATIASVALVVGWLVIDGQLWDRPNDDSSDARDRSRLYNASTLVTLTIGVVICYAALYLLNLLWALFVLDPRPMGGYLKQSFGYADLFARAWFVASAATVGGALGSGLESDDAIRAAAYSKRERDRRHSSRETRTDRVLRSSADSSRCAASRRGSGAPPPAAASPRCAPGRRRSRGPSSAPAAVPTGPSSGCSSRPGR